MDPSKVDGMSQLLAVIIGYLKEDCQFADIIILQIILVTCNAIDQVTFSVKRSHQV